MNKNKKPKILMVWTANNNEQMGGVGYYRIANPARHLKELGYDIDIIAGYELTKVFWKNKEVDETVDVWSNIFSTYDVLWMKHTDSEVALAAIFGLKDKFGCKVIWDFDDDLFNIRPSQPAYQQYHPQSKKRALVSAAMTYCDAITVSTEPLKQSLLKTLKDVYNIEKDIYVCPNFVSTDEWNNVKYYPSNSPVIGYYGSTTHNDDLAIVLPTIYKLLEKHPLVKFQIMGALSSKDAVKVFKDAPNEEVLKRCDLLAGLSGWKGFPELLLRTNWDISIAPLIDDTFNQCKSHIKWMESSMKSIPTVCSNVYPYIQSIYNTDVVKDGVTGFICKPDEWFDTLDKLISDSELRVKIGKQAKEYVKANWSAEKQIIHWEKALKQLLTK